jgi:hypothetical protein
MRKLSSGGVVPAKLLGGRFEMGSGRWLMLAGAVLVLAGIVARRWASRYDLKDAALDSAWTLLRGRRTAENPTAIEAKLRDVQSQPTWTGKATRVAGTGVAHMLAQAGQVVALGLILVGLALAAAGFVFR